MLFRSVIQGDPAIDVTVEGPSDVVTGITPDKVFLYVDVRGEDGKGLPPNEVPWPQQIEASISEDVPRSREVTIRLGTQDSRVQEDAHVKVTERTAR